MHARHAFALLLLGLAGCVAPAPLEASSSSPDAPVTLDEPDATEPRATQAYAEVNEAGPERLETPLDIDGKTPTVLCAIAFPVFGNCFILLQGSDVTEVFEFPGASQSLAATLAWGATTDLTKDLGVGLVVLRDGQPEFQPPYFAEGESPITLDWDLTPFQGEIIGVHVAGYHTAGTAQAHVDVSPGQTWNLRGTIVSLV